MIQKVPKEIFLVPNPPTSDLLWPGPPRSPCRDHWTSVLRSVPTVRTWRCLYWGASDLVDWTGWEKFGGKEHGDWDPSCWKKMVEEMDDFSGVGLIKGLLVTCLSLKACNFSRLFHFPVPYGNGWSSNLKKGHPDTFPMSSSRNMNSLPSFGWSFPKRNPQSLWQAFLTEKIASCYPEQTLSPFASNFPGKTFGVSSQFCRV